VIAMRVRQYQLQRRIRPVGLSLRCMQRGEQLATRLSLAKVSIANVV